MGRPTAKHFSLKVLWPTSEVHSEAYQSTASAVPQTTEKNQVPSVYFATFVQSTKDSTPLHCHCKNQKAGAQHSTEWILLKEVDSVKTLPKESMSSDGRTILQPPPSLMFSTYLFRDSSNGFTPRNATKRVGQDISPFVINELQKNSYYVDSGKENPCNWVQKDLPERINVLTLTERQTDDEHPF
ncbi:hypothetical protein J6590_101321 [Homalodisca vitripennis]|nr:hypothetical protein J6590_101321 [Homalodisca vitripennis]